MNNIEIQTRTREKRRPRLWYILVYSTKEFGVKMRNEAAEIEIRATREIGITRKESSVSKRLNEIPELNN